MEQAGGRGPVGAHGLGAVLTSLAVVARQAFDAAAVSVALVDDAAQVLRYVAVAGAGADGMVGVAIPLGRGIAGWVAVSQQPVVAHDLRSEPRHLRAVAEAAGYVPRSMATVPMVAGSTTVGVLQLLDPAAVVFTDGLAVLEGLARHAAALVEWSDHDVAGTGGSAVGPAVPAPQTGRTRRQPVRTLAELDDARRRSAGGPGPRQPR